MPTATESAPVITPRSEGLAPVSDLLRRVPGRGRTTPATRSRWILHGVDGVRLPAIRISSRWYSTDECVDWFFSERTRRLIESADDSQADAPSKSDRAAVGL